jgi:hypothetical protein
MNINELYPGKFLKAEDIDPSPRVLTIVAVSIEVMPDGSQKPVVTFREEVKKFVCNKTNSMALAKLFGAETDEWRGRRVALVVADVDFKGDVVSAIRVKAAPREVPRAAARPVTVEDLPAEDSIPF